jgi:DNA-binding beta-propeller fold protein YncE
MTSLLLGLCLSATASPTVTSIRLPGGPPVNMDYLAFDAARHRLWVPAGNTGIVDVIETAGGKVTPIAGFPTAPSPRPGRPDVGPSSATVGDGVVWIGNRANSKVCSVDALSFEKGPCVQLASMPDGLAYVSSTRELWVTTPRDQTLTIVKVGGKAPGDSEGAPEIIKVAGAPEGYAVDATRGLFFTNLEDKDRTLAFNVKTRQLVSNWSPGCGTEGPRGLAVDGPRGLLFVACTNGAVALDLAHDGKVVGRLKTGGGVDNIDYDPTRKLLYVASGTDGKLTIASVGEKGALETLATAPTADHARVVVTDGSGAAYVADSTGGQLMVVRLPAP